MLCNHFSLLSQFSLEMNPSFSFSISCLCEQILHWHCKECVSFLCIKKHRNVCRSWKNLRGALKQYVVTDWQLYNAVKRKKSGTNNNTTREYFIDSPFVPFCVALQQKKEERERERKKENWRNLSDVTHEAAALFACLTALHEQQQQRQQQQHQHIQRRRMVLVSFIDSYQQQPQQKPFSFLFFALRVPLCSPLFVVETFHFILVSTGNNNNRRRRRERTNAIKKRLGHHHPRWNASRKQNLFDALLLPPLPLPRPHSTSASPRNI